MGEEVAEKGVLKMDNLSIINKPLDKKIKSQDPWDQDINDNRYIIINKETGKTIDDAQGYGYKTFKSARKAMWYRFEGGKKKTDAAKSEAVKFWKANPQIRSFIKDFYDYNVKEMCLGEISEDDLIKEVNEKFNITLDKKYLGYA